MADAFTPEQTATLTRIWDRLYQLYLERAMGDGPSAQIDAEIEDLIKQRNAIRSWGWNTGQNWAEGMPAEELAKIRKQHA
jgi:hypothetical protein